MRHSKALREVAYHEAGHATAHIWFQHPFDYVTIIPEGISLGHVLPIVNPRVKEIMLSDAPTAGEERYLKHELIILLAGSAAQAKFLGIKKIPSGAGSDLVMLVDICSGLGMSGDIITPYSSYIFEEAKNLIERYNLWEYVDNLANKLLENNKIGYKECKALYKQVVGNIHFDKGKKTINKKLAAATL